jgi:hypothetical protein
MVPAKAAEMPGVSRNMRGILSIRQGPQPADPALPGARLRDTPAMSLRGKPPRPHVALTAATIILALSGCGASQKPSAASSATPAEPQYAEPFTRQQLRVEQGARLFVSDGCSACHLIASKQGAGPNFDSFAGHRVRLSNGHRALVNERFVREALLHPRELALAGYDPAPMIAAVARLHLKGQPGQLTALAAFIEQIGPEPEP